MSGIPKGRRSKSKLEAIHKAYGLRRRIFAELAASFGYSNKKLEAYVRKMTENFVDPEERKEMAKKVREIAENFDVWFIMRERDRVANYTQGITEHLRAGNCIWPTNPMEFQERRLEMDRALECCVKLQDELQFIAETLPTDKNKFCSIVLELDKEVKLIKGLRQADNRFLKELKFKKNAKELEDYPEEL